MTNELEAIKDHHDSRPGPTPEVTARAWMLLVEETERAENGQGQPMRAESGRGQSAWAGSGQSPLARVPRRPLRPLRGLLSGRFAMRAGVAAGLAAAVTAGAILVGGDHATAPFNTPPASAAQLLRKAASVVTQEDLRPGPGQFVYIDRRDITFGSGSQGEYTQEVRREVWTPGEGSGKALMRSTYGQVHVISGEHPEYLPSPGAVEYEREGQCRGGSIAALPLSPADLSADPDRLLAKVRRHAEAFVRSDQRRRGETNLGEDEIGMRVQKAVAMSLLGVAQDPLASSQARATVFGALSMMPVVTIVPDLADPAGRRGVGASIRYEVRDGWERGELIFEKGTYRFLGYQSYIGQQEGGQAKEIRTSGTAVMKVEVVDSMPEVPKDAGKPTFC
ncbi:CU044_5270 family protein [Nonomuraea sp. NPDC050404]|uniref:CU044_5270 family protein n=1 Tax=Nonomuraea sp. NPDC050404 TaxID=3155783 RepID=UPI0033EB5635